MTNTLSVGVEDMKPGVIYRDAYRVGYILAPCEICGKPRAVVVLHGKPKTTRCHPCSNQTLEKRAIMSRAHKGIPWAPEVVQRRREDYAKPDNYHKDPAYRARIAAKMAARPVLDETRAKRSKALKGRAPSLVTKEAQMRKMRELNQDPEFVARSVGRMRSALDNPEVEAVRRAKISKTSQERWDDAEYKDRTVGNILRGLSIRPTKPELALDALLQDKFPKQWIYNGDFAHNVVIGGLVPDFVNVNGEKRVIELFGEHFHKNNSHIKVGLLRTEDGRVAKFKEFGFHCLVIWESEMKHPEKVLARIEAFK